MEDPFKTFDLRCTLTSRLILNFKHINKEQYNTLLTLLKSHSYEDLILVQEILNKLAI